LNRRRGLGVVIEVLELDLVGLSRSELLLAVSNEGLGQFLIGRVFKLDCQLVVPRLVQGGEWIGNPVEGRDTHDKRVLASDLTVPHSVEWCLGSSPDGSLPIVHVGLVSDGRVNLKQDGLVEVARIGRGPLSDKRANSNRLRALGRVHLFREGQSRGAFPVNVQEVLYQSVEKSRLARFNIDLQLVDPRIVTNLGLLDGIESVVVHSRGDVAKAVNVLVVSLEDRVEQLRGDDGEVFRVDLEVGASLLQLLQLSHLQL